MGPRDDDFVNDAPAEAALRRALARFDEPRLAEPPPDLVTRTARRLPAAAPAVAAQHAARAALLRRIALLVVAALVALVALLGIVGALGGGDQLPRLFGDGGSGISRVLLMLQLLSKPLLRTLGAAGVALALAGVTALIAGWLAWWLMRRTPVQYSEQAP